MRAKGMTRMCRDEAPGEVEILVLSTEGELGRSALEPEVAGADAGLDRSVESASLAQGRAQGPAPGHWGVDWINPVNLASGSR